MNTLRDFYNHYGKKLYLVFAVLAVPVSFVAALFLSTRTLSPAGNLAFITAGFANEERGSAYVFFLRILLFFFLAELILLLLSPYRRRFLNFSFRYRYLIAVVFVLLMVLLNVNGSSIASWNTFTGSASSPDIVLGRPRSVRSDEWATFTPMIASQSFNRFQQYSPLFGGNTNTFIIYGLPSTNIFGILFRPFLNGFLLFGFERGLAFFWSARLAALFLAWFELFRKLLHDDRGISLAGAVIISFAPAVQWWFAINGLVEMLIFGPVALLALDTLMRTEKTGFRLLSAFLIYVSGCGIVMTFYPASAVPLVLLYLVLACCFLGIRLKDGTLKNKKQTGAFLIYLGGAVVLMGLTLGLILYQNRETIQAILNTAYPGTRVHDNVTAGFMLESFWANPFYPLRTYSLPWGNECETAAMLDLFPFGYFLAVCAMLKNKKADGMNLALMALSLVLLCYMLFGLPQGLSGLPLLSMTTPERTAVSFEAVNVILLLRAASSLKTRMKCVPALLFAAAFSLFSVCICRQYFKPYFTIPMMAAAAVICLLLIVSLLWYPRVRNLACVLLAGMAFLSGAYINPIQQGSANIPETSLYRAVEAIRETEPEALFALEDIPYPYTNYFLLTGVPSLNATQVSPRFEVFEELDPDGTYREIYNRYAHIQLSVGQDSETFFELLNPDYFKLHLSPEALYETAGVRYVLSRNDLTALSGERVIFEPVFSENGFTIYRLKK